LSALDKAFWCFKKKQVFLKILSPLQTSFLAITTASLPRQTTGNIDIFIKNFAVATEAPTKRRPGRNTGPEVYQGY